MCFVCCFACLFVSLFDLCVCRCLLLCLSVCLLLLLFVCLFVLFCRCCFAGGVARGMVSMVAICWLRVVVVFVDCPLSSAVCCLLLVTSYYALNVVCDLFFAGCYFWFLDSWLPSVVSCVLRVNSWLVAVGCWLWLPVVVCCLLLVDVVM